MTEQWAKDAWAKVQEDQRRTDFIDLLYLQDGRFSKEHPLHSLYTGLYEQWVQNERCANRVDVSSSDVLDNNNTAFVSV